MAVFNAIIKSLKANVANILVYFSIFALFGNIQARATVTEKEEMFEEVTMTVAVMDKDNSNLSNALVDYLKETQKVVDPKLDDPQVINDNVRFGIYQYAVIIPEGFEDKIQAGELENTIEYIAPGTSTSEYLLTQKINDYVHDVVIYLNSGYTQEEAIEHTHQQMMKLADIKPTVMDKSEKNHRSFYQGMFTFNGYTLMMLLCICGASSLTYVKDKDVKNRISVSGMHFITRNAATIGAVFTIGFVITTAVVAVIYFMSSKYSSNKFMYYAIDTYALMFVGLGMAYFICSITSSENLINMITNMIILSMSFLSGVFVDVEFLSATIIKFAHFLPLYWYATAVKFINDTPASQILGKTFGTYLLIEILFAFVFFAAGMIISRKKEQYAI